MSTVQCNCAAIGALGKLLTEDGTSPRTFDASSFRHEFLYETLGSERGLQESNAINGTLQPLFTSVRNKPYIPQGAIAMQASPIEFSRWIPRIFGAATGSDYVSNTLPEFDVIVYRENGIFRYTDAVVAQAVIRGKSGKTSESVEFIDLIVQLIAKSETITQEEDAAGDWPGTEPALGTTNAYAPYAFWESSLEVNNAEIEYDSFTMVVNNMVDYRLNNKQTPTCVRSMGRSIEIDFQLPFTCQAMGASLTLNTTALDTELNFNTTNMHTRFTFPKSRTVFYTPTIPGKTYVPLKMKIKPYATSSTVGLVQIAQDFAP